MKKLVITPELALTIQLLDAYDVSALMEFLIDYANGERGVDREDFAKPLSKAVAYWIAHIDDIITEV